MTPPTGPAVTFTYDPLGNMLTASRGGAVMSLTYDKAGRKKTMDDPDMGFWQYDYDALGNLKTQTDARGCVTNIAYDELNRPTGKTYAGCPTTGAVTYTYDAGMNGKGRRTSMSVTGADFTQWTYDARGRVTSENKQITGGGQFVTAFTYNDADLPVTMTYPDGEVVTFGYNNNMLPVSVSGTDTYAQTIAYDSANRMIQMIRGANKIDTVFTYNNWNVDNGRLQNITSTQVSTGDPLQNLTYDYDSVSNIETIVDSLSGPQTQAFTYDALDRLTNSSVTGGSNGLYTEGYTYEDPNNPNTGNLFSKNGVTYTYSTTHKHAVTSLSNGNTYGYDQNGNMTSRHVFEGTEFKDYTLNYDADREAPLWGNRLVSVTGAAAASFVYDGDGKQIKATVNGITAVYVGNHYEVKNSIVTKYYFAGSTRIAVRKDGTLNFLLADHLGSSSVTTDANGAKTASALYKAFGETRYTLGSLNTDYKFTGQREEASLGIYVFQARWFDPSLGRFLSPDMIVPTSTQGTQAWDRYAFVNNNPVRYTDPTGHMADEGQDEGGDYTWEDQAHDAYLILWARLRRWEAYSAWGLMAGALRHEPHMDIVGQGLDQIRNDPDVLDVQSRLVSRVMADPRYGVEAFATDSIGNDVYLGDQGIDMFNGATWMQRSAKLDATTVSVSEDGVMNISWTTRDTLDLNPDWGGGLRTGINGFLYNSITTVTGAIWHGLLGASNTMTTSASWQTTVYPYCQ